MGFRDSQKRPQAMSNGKTMALLESYKGNCNGAAMGVQCVCALSLPLHGNGKQSTRQYRNSGLNGPRAAAKSSYMETSC
jgi:hypothetical protein